jgi:hypothetical protein
MTVRVNPGQELGPHGTNRQVTSSRSLPRSPGRHNGKEAMTGFQVVRRHLAAASGDR